MMVKTPEESPARFVQIAVSSHGEVFALDLDGDVWIFGDEIDGRVTATWHPFPSARSSVPFSGAMDENPPNEGCTDVDCGCRTPY